ncbi:MAG: sigma-54-dependent transcriptional regulator [Planctomycetota bacterium]
MSENRANILIVDDDTSLATAIAGVLETDGYATFVAGDSRTAEELVREQTIALALVDLRLGKESGLELLKALKNIRPEMSVIMITAMGSIETAVEAMRLGADNFIAKPIDPPRLLALLAKGCEASALRRREQRLNRLQPTGRVVLHGNSNALKRALALADAVAGRDTTVLLLGATGTGKGVLARYVHERSQRSSQPFVELNCAGLARELTESELFGHEKGAFTGALARKLGLFEAADGGTLFLDEVGEMDLAVQAKLLKVLEERRFRRVGGLAEITCDVRLIAATHRDLALAVRENRFREDLLYRLNVFAIPLPPLRERPDDVPALAQYFFSGFRCSQQPLAADWISPAAARTLREYSWPGNVRELRNVIERASILCPPAQQLGLEHLPPLVNAAPNTPGGDTRELAATSTMEERERSAVEDALARHSGNIRAAARELGIARGTLYRKVRKFGIAGYTDDEGEAE